jgi:large repetitive protein
LFERTWRFWVIKGAKPLLSVGAMGLAVLAYACTMRDVTGVEVGEVLVSPSSATLLEGESLRFTAQARDILGNPLPVGAVTWSSDDPSAVAVGADGTARGLQAGQSLVWATLDGVRGSASVAVAPGPTIAAEPASLNFQASFGGPSPNPVQVRITNSGGGALEGLSATVEYPAGSPAGWVTLSLTGTTAPTDLTVSAVTGSLSAGTYSATVRVASQGARNSPVSIPLELEISLDQPVIDLSASSLEFQVEAGGPAPAPRTIQVTNAGGGNLTGLQVLAPGGWLSASLSSTSAPAQLLVQVNPTGLTEGTYQSGIVVRSSLSGVQNQSVDVTLTVVTPPSADLQLTKTGPAAAFVDDTVVFVLTVANGGPDEGRNTTVLDSLPLGLSPVKASGGGAASGRVVTWALGNLAAGSTRTDSLWARVDAPGTLTNVARVTSSSVDPQPADNRAVHPLQTSGIAADLLVEKVGPSVASFLDTVRYVLSVRNAGPSPAANVVLLDSLPGGVSFVSATGGGVLEGERVAWNLGTLGVGIQVMDTVTVVIESTGLLVNVARASSSTVDPAPDNNRAAIGTFVDALADLAVFKSGPVEIEAGGTLEYVITVSNQGPGASGPATVEDSVPPGLAFLSATGGGTIEPSGAVIWSLTNVAPGDSLELRLRARASIVGNVTNVVRVRSGTTDPDSTNNRSTQVTTVTGADLSVTKVVVDGGTPTPGGRITYALSVSNPSAYAANEVVVTDTLPVGVTFVSASSGGALDPGAGPNGVVTWTVGTLTAAQSPRELELVVDIDPSATGVLTNIAAVASSTGDPNLANNRATATTVLGVSSDVEIRKSGPATASPGTQITYSLRISNAGPSDAMGVAVTDTLPVGVAFVSATGGGSLDAGAGPSGVVVWDTIPTIPAGADTAFSVVVRIPPGATGTLRNAAAVTSLSSDPDPANNRGEVTTSLVGSADLAVSKTGPGGGVPGAQITYTITIDNLGPSDATGVVVTDSLPPQVTFVSADPAPSSRVGRLLTWNVGSLTEAAPPMNLTLTVEIDVGTTGVVTNVARVGASTGDPVTANNRSAWNTSVTGANVSVSKTMGTVTAGRPATYTVTVSNGGPSAAENVVVTDTLPDGVTFLSASDVGSYDPAPGPNGVVTWPTIGTLANGASQAYTLTVGVASGRTADLVNTAAVRTTTSDTDLSNNVYTLSSTVETSADLAVSKMVTDRSGVPGRVTAGDTAIYTITVANNGPSDAANVVVTDTLPVVMTFASASPPLASQVGSVVTWPTVSSLPVGESSTYTLMALVPPDGAGDLANVASVGSATSDPVPGNNRVSTSPSAVEFIADLAAEKTGPASAVPGDTITYTVTARNLGPSNAAGVVVRDTLPGGTEFVAATNGGVQDPVTGTVTWTVGDLTVTQGAVSFDLVVAISTGISGAITNIARAGSSTADTIPDNNRATFTTSVSGADVGVTKSAPAGASPGERITYALTVQNSGPSTATGVVLTDTLPPGVTFVSATGGGSHSAGVVTWDVGTLTVGAGAQALEVTVDVNATTSGPVVNIAAARATSTDFNETNNRVTATTQVTSADLSVTKAAGAAVPGTQLTYRLSIANAGPTAASVVVVTDTLPAGVTFVSASDGGSFDGSSRVVTWTIPNLSPTGGSPLGRELIVSIPSGQTGTLTNVAAVASPTHDPSPDNNRYELSTSLAPSADLQLVKRGDTTATAGGTASYGIEATNLGPSNASGVVVTDEIPAGMSYQSATPAPPSVVGQTVTWPTLATLANGASQEYALTVSIGGSTLGERTNTSGVTSSTPDPDSANNSATHTTTVNPGPAAKYLVTSSSSSPVAGSSVTITAQLADANDNPVAIPGAVVTWNSTNGGSFSSPTSATDGSGVATVSFTTSTVAGTEHTVTATDGEGRTGTSPVITTVAGGAAIYVVTSSDHGPVAGRSVTIMAQLADQYGNPTTGPVRTVTWSSTNGGSFNPTTSSSDANGTATTTFTTAAVAGTSHTVTATSGPPSRTGATAPITTVAGPPSPSQTTAIVPGGTAGEVTNILVTVRDANNNKVTGASGLLAGVVTGANVQELAAAVERTVDTTYTTSYTPANAGQDSVAITVGGAAISGSPYVSVVSEPLAAPVNTAPPAITGTARVGETLQATPGGWTGNPTPTLTYQWLRCDAAGTGCTDIGGATATAYTLAAADEGSTLRLAETATNSQGSATATSAPTGVVDGVLAAPVNTAPPAITGTARVGETLQATPGGWTGNPTPTLTYQWLRCDAAGANCAEIGGATATAYTLAAADEGSTLRLAETAANSQGTATATSAPTGVVDPALTASSTLTRPRAVAGNRVTGWGRSADTVTLSRANAAGHAVNTAELGAAVDG